VSDSAVIARHAEALVAEALADTRVVVVNGARQVGKSTLARLAVQADPGASARYLDDAAAREAAGADPAGFVRHPGLLLIDEVQRVPDLLLAIKYEVDQDPRPGRYLLTGSARLLGLREIPDALTGRAETIELWPLSQGEIDGRPDRFVDAAFRHGSALDPGPSDLRKADYVERAVRGGYPEAVRRPPGRRRARYFDSYVADLIARDVRLVSDVERPADLRALLGVIAARMGGLAVVEAIARDVGLPRQTARRYLDVLELVFVVRTIPAWSSNLTQRAVATPKLLVNDSGLAARLIGFPGPGQSVGPLLENFVLGELARQLTWSDEPVRLFHFRDRDGVEVDAVLERASGEVVGVEVKASDTPRSDDFRGLRHLARKLGDRFRAGFVLHTGPQSLPFGDRLRALPVDALWRSDT
jgi:uncharacterized protein